MKRHTLVSAGASQCMRVYDKMVSDVLTGRSGVGCRLPTPVIGALQKGVWNRTGRAATPPPIPLCLSSGAPSLSKSECRE